MKINKENLWNIIEKYDCKQYESMCDSLSNIIRERQSADDFINLYLHFSKIQKVDRDLIEKEVGNQITGVLFSL